MGVIAQLGQRAEAIETRAAAAEFHKFARTLTATRGEWMEAAALAQQTRAKPRVVEIFKSAVTGAGLADWSALTDYQTISAAFSESLRSAGVFDAMLAGGIVPAPLRSRGIIVTTGITGSSPSERSIKPIGSIALGNSLVEPKKSAAVIVTTEEVAKSADANINALFDSELRQGVIAATDSIFLSTLIAGTTPTASAGATLGNITTDLGVLLSAVTSRASSKLYFIIDPTNAKKLTLKASSTGAPAFPGMGVNGGEIVNGVTCLVSDQLPAGTALMADATGIAGSADVIVLDASQQSVVQMETSPDSPPFASSALLSLWQSNLFALRCERFFGFVVLRSSAVASLSGVNY
jgi:hypothetical protein